MKIDMSFAGNRNCMAAAEGCPTNGNIRCGLHAGIEGWRFNPHKE